MNAIPCGRRKGRTIDSLTNEEAAEEHAYFSRTGGRSEDTDIVRLLEARLIETAKLDATRPVDQSKLHNLLGLCWSPISYLCNQNGTFATRRSASHARRVMLQLVDELDGHTADIRAAARTWITDLFGRAGVNE